MTVTANQVTVTPELAQKWLDSSKGNRHVARNAVMRLAADMRAGKWRYNGDRIRFLADGTLYDGHHRLNACVESGCSIVTDIFVMPEDAKSTVDKGKSRTTADNFAMEGLVDASMSITAAATTRILTIHDNTEISDWARNTSGGQKVELLTDQALEEFFIKNKDVIISATKWAHENIKKQDTLISKSQAAAFLVLAGREFGRDQAESYLYSVLTGFGVEPDTTVHHVRARLLSVKMRQAKMAINHKMYMVCKGFRSIMAGRKIKHAHNVAFRPSADNIPRFEVTK